MKHPSVETTFRVRRTEFDRAFKAFIRSANTGLDATLLELWERVGKLQKPFVFDSDADMAKVTFENGRSFHVCTSSRRFHRPTKTGKPRSVTIMLGGFKRNFDDPEDQLIPCDAAQRVDCCYFGVAEDEEDLAMFFIEQMVGHGDKKKPLNVHAKAHITPRRKRG